MFKCSISYYNLRTLSLILPLMDEKRKLFSITYPIFYSLGEFNKVRPQYFLLLVQRVLILCHQGWKRSPFSTHSCLACLLTVITCRGETSASREPAYLVRRVSILMKLQQGAVMQAR